MARGVIRVRLGGKTSPLKVIRYSVDLWTAALLLTGKISIVGVFVVTEGFFLSATGPVLGGPTTQGHDTTSDSVTSAINVISALLLICNAIRVTGPYVSSQRLTIVFSGPIFGIKEIVGTVEPSPAKRQTANELSYFVRDTLLSQMKGDVR